MTAELVTPQMRADALAARDIIIDQANQISKLRMALSCTLPVVEIYEPKLHRLIVAAVGYGPMPDERVTEQVREHGICLVVDNSKQRTDLF